MPRSAAFSSVPPKPTRKRRNEKAAEPTRKRRNEKATREEPTRKRRNDGRNDPPAAGVVPGTVRPAAATFWWAGNGAAAGFVMGV